MDPVIAEMRQSARTIPPKHALAALIDLPDVGCTTCGDLAWGQAARRSQQVVDAIERRIAVEVMLLAPRAPPPFCVRAVRYCRRTLSGVPADGQIAPLRVGRHAGGLVRLARPSGRAAIPSAVMNTEGRHIAAVLRFLHLALEANDHGVVRIVESRVCVHQFGEKIATFL